MERNRIVLAYLDEDTIYCAMCYDVNTSQREWRCPKNYTYWIHDSECCHYGNTLVKDYFNFDNTKHIPLCTIKECKLQEYGCNYGCERCLVGCKNPKWGSSL